jgi:hypothetical protein
MTIYTVLVTHGDSADPDAWFASVSESDGVIATFKGASAYGVLSDAARAVDRLAAVRPEVAA